MSLSTTQINRYSQIVGILKIVLPLIALGLLSSVFLFARTIDPSRAIPMAEIDVEDRARDPRLSGARFAGVTADGAAITIETETARSDPNAALRLDVTGLVLELEGSNGETLFARSNEGVLDRAHGRFDMSGGLNLIAAPGYHLSSERIHGLLDNTFVESPGPVSGEAPAGQISAGNMHLRTDPATNTGYVLVFGGGVRLYYQPEN